MISLLLLRWSKYKRYKEAKTKTTKTQKCKISTTKDTTHKSTKRLWYKKNVSGWARRFQPVFLLLACLHLLPGPDCHWQGKVSIFSTFCICVCICVCICICFICNLISISICICVSISICIRVCICICVCLHIFICLGRVSIFSRFLKQFNN